MRPLALGLPFKLAPRTQRALHNGAQQWRIRRPRRFFVEPTVSWPKLAQVHDLPGRRSPTQCGRLGITSATRSRVSVLWRWASARCMGTECATHACGHSTPLSWMGSRHTAQSLVGTVLFAPPSPVLPRRAAANTLVKPHSQVVACPVRGLARRWWADAPAHPCARLCARVEIASCRQCWQASGFRKGETRLVFRGLTQRVQCAPDVRSSLAKLRRKQRAQRGASSGRLPSGNGHLIAIVAVMERVAGVCT